MTFTIQISGTLRGIIDHLPQRAVVETTSPMTLKRLATDIGIPPILVVIAFVNGRKINLDERLDEDAEIYFMGPVAGG